MGAIKDSRGIDPFSALTLSLWTIDLVEKTLAFCDIGFVSIKLITNEIKFTSCIT